MINNIKTKSINDGVKFRLYVLFSLLLVIGFSCVYCCGMINNGDYDRVCNGLIDGVVAWKPLHQEYAITKIIAFPKSTAAAFVQLLVVAHKVVGLKYFHILSLAVLYGVIYWVGICCAIFYSRIFALLFALNYFIYYYYFQSLYEEAAVLSLVPWVFVGIKKVYLENKEHVFVISSCLMLAAKSQMLFFLPIFALCILGNKYLSRKKRVAYLLLLIVVAGSTILFNRYEANNYNRLYNGIGWGLQNVEDWPANNFNDRRAYFYSHSSQLQQKTINYEPVEERIIMGTSYWPTGDTIRRDAFGPGGSEEDKKQYDSIIKKGSIGNYMHFLYAHQSIIGLLIKNTYRISLISDYSVSYLRSSLISKGNVVLKKFLDSIEFIRMSYGYIFYLIALVTCVCCCINFSMTNLMVTVYYFLVSPLFALMGDGFYEYEKHMMPYLFLALLPLMLVLSHHKKPCYDNKIGCE